MVKCLLSPPSRWPSGCLLEFWCPKGGRAIQERQRFQGSGDHVRLLHVWQRKEDLGANAEQDAGDGESVPHLVPAVKISHLQRL